MAVEASQWFPGDVPWQCPLPDEWSWVDRGCRRVADLIARGAAAEALDEAEQRVLDLRPRRGDVAALALLRARVMQLLARHELEWPRVQAFDASDELWDLLRAVTAETRAWLSRVPAAPARFTLPSHACPETADAWNMHWVTTGVFKACCWYDGGINFGFFNREIEEHDGCAVALALCGYPGPLLNLTKTDLADLEGLTQAELLALCRRSVR